MVPYLETEKITLRPINSADAQNLCDLNSDPEVMRYLDDEPDMKSVLPMIVARNERYHNQLGLFAAIEKATGEFIGWFILRPDRETPDDTTNLEIGYRLKRKFWGKGIASEISHKLVKKAVSDFKAIRIYGEAMKENLASIRVLEKIGLIFESEIVEDVRGKNVTIALYSRTFS